MNIVPFRNSRIKWLYLNLPYLKAEATPRTGLRPQLFIIWKIMCRTGGWQCHALMNFFCKTSFLDNDR